MRSPLYFTKLIAFLPLLSLPACNQARIVEEKDARSNAVPSEKEQVLLIGESIVRDRTDNDLIWNIEHLDTGEFWSSEDYFIKSGVKNKLVLLGGKAGASAGTEDNLLIIFDDRDPKKILWSGQTGDIAKNQVRDLDGDGIKELVFTKSNTYMGECSAAFEIVSFRDAKRKILFSRRSRSVIDCGSEEVWKLYKIGDTLQSQYVHEIVPAANGGYEVKESGDIKIYAGGRTNKEMKAKLIKGESAWTYKLR